MTRPRKQEADRSAGSHPIATIQSPQPITVGLDKSISINYAAIDPPRNVYDADYAWAERKEGTVSLFFGKQDRNDPSLLRTRLEIRYPDASFLAHLWKTTDGPFREKMNGFLKKLPPTRSRAAAKPETMKAL
jgi:hypothetical protein